MEFVLFWRTELRLEQRKNKERKEEDQRLVRMNLGDLTIVLICIVSSFAYGVHGFPWFSLQYFFKTLMI